MRRNTSGTRGGLNTSGGPLITEHLKDLDLELELLKRKREMIEQQQQFYTPQYALQSQYEPPSYNQRNFDSNRDFSHLYDEGPSYGQHGRKRHVDPWEHDNPQMFPNKKKPIQSIFGSRLGPKPSPPGPSLPGPAPTRWRRQPPNAGYSPKGYSPKPNKSPAALMTVKTNIGQKFNKQPLLKPPQGLSKVGKPKPATAPNNIASKPVAERVNLVAEATKSSAAVDESLILREDCPPTRQMTGRLELTLGVIMKEIKDRYGNTPAYATVFNTVFIQRVMKQAIRERIRVVMLGKVVGSNTDIKRQYREEYPEDTDIDILNIALAAAGMPPEVKPDTTQVKSVDEEKTLKDKMCDMIDARLDVLFTKLKELCAKECQEKTSEPLEQTVVTDDGSEGKVKDEAADGRHTPKTIVRRFLPRLLKKYTTTIAGLMDCEEIYATAKESIASDAAQTATAAAHSQDDRQEMSLNALPYYVKIKAKPKLPNKTIMREFLASFNTKTIKKHKTIHCLLFVGFSNKIDYDNMLAASGTVIGTSTLEILPSEKAAPKRNQEDNNSLDISPELDGQITDLLTSIRKAEEEEQAKDDQENDEKMDTSVDIQLKDGVTDENGSANMEVVIDTAQIDEGNTNGTTEDQTMLENPEATAEGNQKQSENNATTENSVIPTDSAQNTDKVSESLPTEIPKEAGVPQQAAEGPEKAAEATANVGPTPTKVATTPVEIAPTSAKVAVTPTKVASTPAKVTPTLAKVASTPVKAAETTANVAATPAKVSNTPAKVAATTAKVALTPAKVNQTPAKVASTPAKVAETTEKVAETAVKAAPTPTKVSDTPVNVAATPAKPANVPAKVAGTTAKVTSTPAKVNQTPAKVASTPAKVAETNEKVAETAVKISPTAAKVSDTPANVAATPAKVSDTPANVTATPAKPANSPAKVAESPAKVADTAAGIADNTDQVAETPKNDAVISNMENEKSDTVAELKSDAKDTGRSTPTRMTRSANVTPSTIRTRRASRLAQNQ